MFSHICNVAALLRAAVTRLPVIYFSAALSIQYRLLVHFSYIWQVCNVHRVIDKFIKLHDKLNFGTEFYIDRQGLNSNFKKKIE